MKRRDFMKGIAVAGAVAAVPAIAKIEKEPIKQPKIGYTAPEEYHIVSASSTVPRTCHIEGIKLENGEYVHFEDDITISEEPVTLPYKVIRIYVEQQ